MQLKPCQTAQRFIPIDPIGISGKGKRHLADYMASAYLSQIWSNQKVTSMILVPASICHNSVFPANPSATLERTVGTLKAESQRALKTCFQITHLLGMIRFGPNSRYRRVASRCVRPRYISGSRELKVSRRLGKCIQSVVLTRLKRIHKLLVCQTGQRRGRPIQASAPGGIDIDCGFPPILRSAAARAS